MFPIYVCLQLNSTGITVWMPSLSAVNILRLYYATAIFRVIHRAIPQQGRDLGYTCIIYIYIYVQNMYNFKRSS